MPNVENLQQLKRVVRDRPDDQFDMVFLAKKTDCGTVACAIGSAAMDPWFLQNTPISSALSVAILPDGEVKMVISHDMDDILAELFDLCEEDIDNLFYTNTTPGNVTKDMVLENIDRLIAGLLAEEYPWRPI